MACMDLTSQALQTTAPHPTETTNPDHLATTAAAPIKPQATAPVLAQAISLSKVYGQGDTAVHALRSVNLSFAQGQFTAIMGPSGSGKSTLMHCLAGLDKPTSGTVHLDGQVISQLPERALTKLRRTQIGFIFQSFNLVASLTAAENITLPLDLAHRKADPKWHKTVIQTLGLEDRLTHKPAELSGGQQQRVACARALVTKPAIIMADEPTGNLDSASSRELMALLRRCVRELGQTLVMVTHDSGAAAYADRVVFLDDGRVAGQITQPTVDGIDAAMRAIRQGQPITAQPTGAQPGRVAEGVGV